MLPRPLCSRSPFPRSLLAAIICLPHPVPAPLLRRLTRTVPHRPQPCAARWARGRRGRHLSTKAVKTAPPGPEADDKSRTSRTCAKPRVGDGDGTTVSCDNLAHDRQAQPGAA